MEDDNELVVVCVCPNCGAYIDEIIDFCPTCNAHLSESNDSSAEVLLESSTIGNAIFICQNCSAFIGVDSAHCYACGAKRSQLTAKVDFSRTYSDKLKENQSNSDSLLESSTALFLCESCGAFLGPNAVNCEICETDVGITDIADTDFEEEEPLAQEENMASDLLSSEGAIFLCNHCGAFIKPEAMYCSICSLAVEPVEFDEVDVPGPEYAESKLNNSGTLYLCESCGAFIRQDADMCSSCGTVLLKEAHAVKEKTSEDIQAQTEVSELVEEFVSEDDGSSIADKPNQPERITAKEYLEFLKRDKEADQAMEDDIAMERPVTDIQKETEPELKKESKRLWYKKALALKKLGRYDSALRCLNKALSLDPDDDKILLEKADICYELGRHEQAVKLYRKLLDSTPENITLWNKIGNTLFRLGYQKESEICYDKALNLDENNRVTIINKGYLLMKQERYDEATDFATKILP